MIIARLIKLLNLTSALLLLQLVMKLLILQNKNQPKTAESQEDAERKAFRGE